VTENISVFFPDRTFPDAASMLRELTRAEPVDVLVGEAHQADVVIPMMKRIDGKFMDKVDGLRLIQQWGAGLEGVDIAEATRRGILVGNVPSASSGNAESVAEWCVMAALALSRDLLVLDNRMRGGRCWGGPAGQAMLGRTATIVGLGGIGRALARRLAPFGLTVRAATRTPNDSLAAELGLDRVTGMARLPELLAETDYLFLSLPLSPETAGLLNAETLALLPEGAFVVNVGRGGLVDHDAMVAALRSGRLAGAALDVFPTEPLDPASSLLTAPNLLATPHIAGVTDVSYRYMGERILGWVTDLRLGRPLPHCVNWAEVR
jgi:phosphoglycerate dehydrogenase-like enzyme